jgi:hypothetical protein
VVVVSAFMCDYHFSEGEGEHTPRSKVQKMLVVDCRSYSAAIANRAKGGGCESPGCQAFHSTTLVMFSFKKKLIKIKMNSHLCGYALVIYVNKIS